jgi:UDP-glucose 4-epimerase
LSIFGHDYDTPDGTGVRDYIHVVDLALRMFLIQNRLNDTGCRVWNIGTGNGISVQQIKDTFEKSIMHIPFEYAPRRAGDVATTLLIMLGRLLN